MSGRGGRAHEKTVGGGGLVHVSAGKNRFLLLCSQSGTKLLLPVCWPEAEIKDCAIQVFRMRMVALRRSTLFSDAGVHRSATGIFTFEPTVLFCDPAGHKSSLRPLCPSFILFTRNATTHNVCSAYSYRRWTACTPFMQPFRVENLVDEGWLFEIYANPDTKIRSKDVHSF